MPVDSWHVAQEVPTVHADAELVAPVTVYLPDTVVGALEPVAEVGGGVLRPADLDQGASCPPLPICALDITMCVEVVPLRPQCPQVLWSIMRTDLITIDSHFDGIPTDNVENGNVSTAGIFEEVQAHPNGQFVRASPADY